MKKILLCTLLILIFALFGSISVAQTKDTLVPAIGFTSGEEYVLGLPGINDKNGAFGEACPAAAHANEYGLDYAKRPQTKTEAETKFLLWTITQKEDGSITVYSKEAEEYLRLEPDVNNENGGRAYLSEEPQDLKAEISGGKIKIYTEVNNTKYYFRFTNLHANSCLHSGHFTSSNLFTLYTTADKNVVGEYDNTGKTPLLTVACFADLHVDYGIQSWNPPIRQGTVNAVKALKDMGGADVVLVGGDILSTNDTRSPWSEQSIKASMDTVYETLMKGSTKGLVFPVTGNHDSEPGNAAGGKVYSGDWEPYLLEYAGDFDAVSRNTGSKFNEVLGYRYSYFGMEFININTPYLPTRSSGLYASQAQWLEEQLKSIDKNKTVIVTCHYPVVHAQYPITTVSGGGDARKAFEDVVKKYPNVLWCYGHVHHNDSEYANYSAAEKITPSGTTTKNADNSYTTNGYVSCHMGSMGYYDNKFQPGGLQAAEPQIVQFMLMEFYEDHITFSFHNTGEKTAVEGVLELGTYTIRRDLSQLKEATNSEEENPNGNHNQTSDNATNSDKPANSDPVTDEGTDTDTQNDTDTALTDSNGNATETNGTDSDNTESSDSNESVSDTETGDEIPEEGGGILLPVLVLAGVLLLGGGGAGLWFFLKKKKS